MIDQWFKKDLQKIYEHHEIAVFIDESGDADFLIGCLGGDYQIFKANSELEELHIKYLIEKQRSESQKYLIYTCTEKNKLKFIREYCETDGCLEIRYLQNYIKEKVHQTLNLNINLAREELLAAAKVSIGKDKSYWLDLSHKGASEIFDLETELLLFLHDPAKYNAERFDKQLREAFYQKVHELVGLQYIDREPPVLANEVACRIFENLLISRKNEILDRVYANWLDSVSYKSSLMHYLNKFKIPHNFKSWEVSLEHPFQKVDEIWLKEIGSNLGEKEKLPEYIRKITARHNNRKAQAAGIRFWGDVLELIQFDAKNISYLSSLDEVIDFYKLHFSKVDNAIRRLYSVFLNNRDLIEPFQELYKELVAVFLDRWFKFFNSYKETQTGALQRIIDENSDKVAIIVGDGVAYEVAQEIAGCVQSSIKLSPGHVLADFPSETENNMSRIFIDDGTTRKIHLDRVKYLLDKNPGKKIEFIDLDTFDGEEKAAQYLICTHKDFDTMGEKFQHKALKYFPETISSMARKIELLLQSGYKKVFLISDHGFVLSGLLCEADKIPANTQGVAQKAERYILANDEQPELLDSLIEIKKKHGSFNYLYFSRTLNPFKTTGPYGYSHGGLSPQELVTPFFCWQLSAAHDSKLPVNIANKADLESVAGEIYQIKLSAGEVPGNLLSLNRKVYLVFFKNGAQSNKSDILTISRNDKICKEYSFDGAKEIEIQLLDADTKECLDHTKIRRSSDRDLGGLL